MSKEILVNVGERETRIAVLEEGKLTELHVEREERVVGSLYKARVSNVLPGMDAAFVDIGLERNAFLYVGDVIPTTEEGLPSSGAGGKIAMDDESDRRISPEAAALLPLDSLEDEDDEEGEEGEESDLPDSDSAPVSGEPAARGRGRGRKPSIRRSVLRHQKIRDVLKIGQEILVQVIKGPRGTKGARVSTRISLPGRYLVLMPEADNIGVSRKIADGRERDRLKKIGEKLREPGFGIIIRTEAEDKTEIELKADKDFLIKLWRQIQDTYRKNRAPATIHQDLTLVYKTIRDVFGSDVSRLVIDDPAEFEKANDLLDMVSPKLRGRIHLYTGEPPIFDHFNVENEIDRLLKNKVWLKSGGYLIFDETEALTVIDVNTGKYTGGGSLSETIVRTNTDAAIEIARQLRLRDIGGIIVIDFIDMNNPRDKQLVIKALETALKKDRSRTKISSLSGLGLVEMTRKRTGETIGAFMMEPCTYCGGRGKLPSAESVSILAERELKRVAKTSKKDRDALHIVCHPDVAECLIGIDGETVDRIEREIQKAVYVRAEPTCHLEKFEIAPGEISEFDKRLTGIKRSQTLELRLAPSILQAETGVIAWQDGFLIGIAEGRFASPKQAGQKVKAKVVEARRSYAAAAVMQPNGRGPTTIDKGEPI